MIEIEQVTLDVRGDAEEQCFMIGESPNPEPREAAKACVKGQ